MKDRSEITALVCEPHCRFYRPGAKEELACGGYRLFSDRVSAELAREWTRERRSTPLPQPFPHSARIEKLICATCPFRESDCDFMGKDSSAGAAPCGGYVLLTLLLQAGVSEAEAWLAEAKP